MFVGICRITLGLPAVDSLKGKRAIVRKIVDRSRARFNVAMAEVDTLDSLRYATVGFAVVSNESPHVQSMLDTITASISGMTEATIADRNFEIVPFGHHFGAQKEIEHGSEQ